MSSSIQEQQLQKNGAFRAPPPSPIATGQGIKSAGVNNEILSEFLEQSIRIPELNLPEPFIRLDFPNQDLPAFDLLSLRSPDLHRATSREMVQSAIEFGCFQITDHGISPELIERAEEQCNRLFALPVEKKQMVCRSEESRFGFEHIAVGDAVNRKKQHETFWVDGNEDSLERTMKDVWPEGFRNFSWAMYEYSAVLESIASEILEVLYENLNLEPSNLKELLGSENSSVLCLYSHEGPYKSPSARLRHSHSHVLSVHHHRGSSAFYVYADHGWTTVNIKPDSLVITVGNILKVWSDGLFKSVIGRPITSGDIHFISMEFLYSPPSNICRSRSVGKMVKVSLVDQFFVAILLIFMWNLFSYLRS